MDASTLVMGASTKELAMLWPKIRGVWKGAHYGAFATVGPDGAPHITPIGSLYLHPSEPRGYYHPVLTTQLRKNLTERPQFELLLVDTRATRWLAGLVRGAFREPIAVRLRGHALGPRREVSAEESTRWQRTVRPVRWTRAYDLLWKDVRFVQELAFDELVPIRFGKMRNG
jgi:hypothetical protein